ncbi:unnamed protein product [Paramecium pentaurelia]|uniref:Uncharacterized protein n=1 Tax=Paramecium pentaurelia TaxID=43138 RepID=A0A8S1T8A2_9CILI|nr:unnamed protein product [Paramecium pentaurelia]
MEYINETFKNLEVYQNGQLISYQYNQTNEKENYQIDELIKNLNLNLSDTKIDDQIINQFSQMNCKDN